jgi:hypothetical protein
MNIACSNCRDTVIVSFTNSTVSHTTKAHGRGNKRIEAATTINDLFSDDNYFYTWEAPCCEDYWDSYERIDA